MTRMFGLALALLASLFTLVPSVAAAEPWAFDEHLVVSTGGPFTLESGQHVDLLVIVSGDATIEGDAGSVVVIDGTVTFIATQTTDVLAIRSRVVVDAASSISGDVSVLDSSVEAAPSAVGGNIKDLSGELAGAWILGDVARIVLFAGFLLAAMFVALGLAAVASRQVRAASASIGQEPLAVAVAAIFGLIGAVLVGVLAIATIVGAPTGLAILGFGLPALLIGGYAIVAIWLGELVLARVTPSVDRERPYLAAVVGVAVLGALSIIPIVGGLLVLAGFGAVVLYLWRAVRAGAQNRRTQPVAAPASA